METGPSDPGPLATGAALLSLFTLSVMPFVAGLLQGQVAGLPGHVAAACATAVLLGMVWRGSVWAWRLTVSFSMVAGLLVFVGGMLASGSGLTGWIVSAAGVGYLLLGTALVGVPAIRSFLDRRWAARSGRP